MHFGRLSLLIRVGGGNLIAPLDKILDTIDWSPLSKVVATPSEKLLEAVAFLENLVCRGALRSGYVAATLVLVANCDTVFIWNVGPSAVFSGDLTADLHRKTDDLRMPELRKHGLVLPKVGFEESELLDQVSSIFAVGTPDGYQSLMVDLRREPVVLVLDRGLCPFGPTPSIRLSDLDEADAGWQYGMKGQGLMVAIGNFAAPIGWTQRDAGFPW